MKEENEMKDLVKYLAYSKELDKKKEELAKISLLGRLARMPARVK